MASASSPAEQVLANGDLAREIARLVACGNPSGEHLAKSDRICRAFYHANTPLWKQLCRTRYPSSTYLQGSFSLFGKNDQGWRRTFGRRRVAEECVGAPLQRSFTRSCQDYVFTFELLTLSAGEPVYWGTFGSIQNHIVPEEPIYGATAQRARCRKPLNLLATNSSLEPGLVARVFVSRNDGALACLMNTGDFEFDDPEFYGGYYRGEVGRDEVSVRFTSTGALPLLQWRDGQRVAGIESSSECNGVTVTLRFKCKFDVADDEHGEEDDSDDDSDVEPRRRRNPPPGAAAAARASSQSWGRCSAAAARWRCGPRRSL